MIELYHSQRAMRAMRSAALQRGVIAVLDVGTSKIGCLILKLILIFTLRMVLQKVYWNLMSLDGIGEIFLLKCLVRAK